MKRRNFLKAITGIFTAAAAPSLVAKVVENDNPFKNIDDYKGNIYEGEIGSCKGLSISPNAKKIIREGGWELDHFVDIDTPNHHTLTVTGLTKGMRVTCDIPGSIFTTKVSNGEDITFKYSEINSVRIGTITIYKINKLYFKTQIKLENRDILLVNNFRVGAF